MATFSSSAKLYSESLMRLTVWALSNHAFTLAGLALSCSLKSSYMTWFSFAELAVVRLRLSSTMEKPLSTSVETFKASMAIRTTYIRFIIFWRGETGLFFIAISLYFPIGRPPRHGRGLPCKQKCLGTLAAGRQSLSGAAAFMLTVMASIMRE